MRFLANGTIGHGPSGKTLHDRFNGFHLLNRYGWPIEAELEQPSQGCEIFILVIHQAAVLPVLTVITATGCVLKFRHGSGIKEMVFSIPPPLVLPAPFQIRLL